MNIKKYRQVRIAVAAFVGIIVSIAVNLDSYLLAVSGVATGMMFLTFVRSKTKIVIDERESTIREKAAQLTYAIFTPTIGIGACLMLMPSMSGLSVFAKGEFLYLESLGMILAYLTLFLIATYSISYYFLNKRFGGGNTDEEQN
jgi:uncharacterized membrane protein